MNRQQWIAGLAAREGVPLPGVESEKVSLDIAAVFATPEGQRVLAHLRRITTGRVLGPEDPDAALRDLEGRRALMALLDMRINHGSALRRGFAEPGANVGAGSGF